MHVDHHHLRVFVAVSRTGNVARAADLLQLTASPVSRSLRELERQTGPLFERAYHDMRLLPRGQELLTYAVDALQLVQDFEEVADHGAVTLRFAMTPWVPDWSADLLLEALDSCSLPAAEGESAVSSTLLNDLRHGELDLALVHLPVQIPGVESRAVQAYRFELLVPSGDPLEEQATPDGIDITAVAGRKLLLSPTSMQPLPSTALRDWLLSAGAAEVEELTMSDLPLRDLRLRRSGALAVAATDNRAEAVRNGRVVRIPLLGEQPTFEFGLVWRVVNPSRLSVIATISETFANLVARRRTDDESLTM